MDYIKKDQASQYVDNKFGIEEYKAWHKDTLSETLEKKGLAIWYSESLDTASNYENSKGFSRAISAELKKWNSEYQIEKGYELLTADNITLVCKSFDSVINKIYRSNYVYFTGAKKVDVSKLVKLENSFNMLNDTIRGLIIVKYLDGVDYLAEKIKQLGESHGIDVVCSKQARTEGYFAQHLYYEICIDIKTLDWSYEKFKFKVEIQIATQLQDVIRKLTHKQYESRRIKFEPRDRDNPWQWNYKADEFFLNGLGHMIHYLEGMILEIRDKKCKGE